MSSARPDLGPNAIINVKVEDGSTTSSSSSPSPTPSPPASPSRITNNNDKQDPNVVLSAQRKAIQERLKQHVQTKKNEKALSKSHYTHQQARMLLLKLTNNPPMLFKTVVGVAIGFLGAYFAFNTINYLVKKMVSYLSPAAKNLTNNVEVPESVIVPVTPIVQQ